VSTRRLIIAALVTGVAILVAGAFQFLQIANDQHSRTSPPAVATTQLGPSPSSPPTAPSGSQPATTPGP